MTPKTTVPQSQKADEYVVYIILDLDISEWKARIGSKLTYREKELFTNFLQANKDVFVWSIEHMLGIDPSTICHWLHLDPTAKPIT